jgi:hypothetical protein
MTARRYRCFALLWALLGTPLWAEDYDRPPISYSQAVPDNCISRLQDRLDAGEVQLEFDGHLGYLRALLSEAKVPVESQMLVFSKTSLQRHRISPRTPRAIYFNDELYVGFCQSGEVLEISAVDPQLGSVFYTLDQEAAESPRFVRQTENCLLCHSSSRTGGVPGHVVRSLLVDAGGLPLLAAGSYTVDHTTPLEHRWGGWYVTGKHGAQTHLGNLIVRDKYAREPVSNPRGQNVCELDEWLSLDKYPLPHSDIVALMVLEHQALVHNRLTQANFSTRQALHYQAELARALGEPESKPLESTGRRIASAGDDLVDALLLVEEAKITAPIAGTSGFAEVFARQGPRDRQGRSLRDFDLSRRLFKYPCSYLVYSEAFDALPDEMRRYVWQRLWDVLSGADRSEKYAHLSSEDRRAMIEILRDTKPDLPDYWRPDSPATAAGE